MMTQIFRTRSSRAGDIPRTSAQMDYPFRYFSDRLPYIPLAMVGYKHIYPLAVLKSRYGSERFYMSILQHTFTYNEKYCREFRTRGRNMYASGPGMLFDVTDNKYVPIFMVVVPVHVFKLSMALKDFVEEYKHHIEVMFHNDIRSLNPSLWNYIRKYYFEVLQLEGIRFTFRSPEEIMDLTTIPYTKPKFKSMDEMVSYKERMKSLISVDRIEL